MNRLKRVRGSKIREEESKDILIDVVDKDTKLKKNRSAKVRGQNLIFRGDSSSFQDIKSASRVQKIKTRKVRLGNVLEDEQSIDRELEQEDTISITVIVLILVACFVVGIVLGYMLYRLAIDSSAIILLEKKLLL